MNLTFSYFELTLQSRYYSQKYTKRISSLTICSDKVKFDSSSDDPSPGNTDPDPAYYNFPDEESSLETLNFALSF